MCFFYYSCLSNNYTSLIFYYFIGLCKLLTLWFKRNTFRQLIEELADIWPVTPENQEEEDIKQESLKELRLGQFCKDFEYLTSK